MKAGIHPEYHDEVTVTCSCGNKFVTGSTVDSIHNEICSACHPFYTGEVKYVDLAGRVDKFEAKLEKAKIQQSVSAKKKARQKAREEARKNAPDSLKSMLRGAKQQVAQAQKADGKKKSASDSSSAKQASDETSDDE